MVANSGGHLEQLVTLAPRLTVDDEMIWVTQRTAQSEALLQGRETRFVTMMKPRDYRGVISRARELRRIVRDHDVKTIVSTGASLALSAALASTAGSPRMHYIESATRTHRLSRTGAALNAFPAVQKYFQYPDPVPRGWMYRGSVFDGFDAQRIHSRVTPHAPLRVLVSLGANEQYRFPRLIAAVQAVSLPSWNITWQIGATPVDNATGDVTRALGAASMQRHIDEADLVIAHAGTGTVLSCLKAGKIPIVLPRDPRRAEHVDGHQIDLAAFLQGRGLAVVGSDGAVTRQDVERALATRVVTTESTQFELR